MFRHRYLSSCAIAGLTVSSAAPADLIGSRHAIERTASTGEYAHDRSDVPIVESRISTQILYLGTSSSIRVDHFLFFQNGIVVRASPMIGTLPTAEPVECYAALPVTNLGSLPLNYGRWREDKSMHAIHIDWSDGRSWSVQRQGERWVAQGNSLLKLQPVDGLNLAGVYVLRRSNDPPTAFAFTADGKFEVRNLFDDMTCPNGQPSIANGVGTYKLHKWTLILRFSNGVTALIPIGISDEDQARRNVKTLTVKGYQFEMVR